MTSQHERQLAHRSCERRFSALRRRWVGASLVALFVATLAVPAFAYFGSSYSWYDGVFCGWDGSNEHWDYNSPTFDRAGGATGLQYGYPDECDRTRLKMYWEPYNQGPRLDIWYGSSGVNPGGQSPAEFLFYTDHDVRRGSLWSGFRLNH